MPFGSRFNGFLNGDFNYNDSSKVKNPIFKANGTDAPIEIHRPIRGNGGIPPRVGRTWTRMRVRV